MAKKKRGPRRGAGSREPEARVLSPVPERLVSPFKSALEPLKQRLEAEAKQAQKTAQSPRKPVRKAAPAPVRPHERGELPEDDATALSLAMQGVKPLGQGGPARVAATTPRVESRTAKVAPFGTRAEDEARARLDELVAHEVSFRIESDRDYVRAARADAPPRVVRELARRTRASETLDLHGLGQRDAREAVVRFIRGAHQQGLSVVCIVHGKGQHSEGGLGVLRDVAVRALTDTGAAPLVYAFVTAPPACGGGGALLVELKH